MRRKLRVQVGGGPAQSGEGGVQLGAPGRPAAGRDAGERGQQGCSYSDELEARLLAVPGVRPRLTLFGSVDAARGCVAAGLGLTLLPLTTVEDQLRQGRLARVPGPGFADVPVRLARHGKRWVSPAARAFTREVVRHFSGWTAAPGT